MHFVLAAMLGPASFGAFALGFYSLQLLHSIGALGLYNGIQHFAPAIIASKTPANASPLFRKALILALCASCFLAFTLWLLTDSIAVVFQSQAFAESTSALAPALPFLVASTLVAYSFNVLGKPWKFTLARDVFPFVFMFMGIAIFATPNLKVEVISQGATAGFAFFGTMALIYFLFSLSKGSQTGVDAISSRELLAYSIPTALASGASLLYVQSDRLMLGLLSSDADVGVYSVSATICTQLSVLPATIAIILAPRLAKHRTSGSFSSEQSLFSQAVGWSIFLVMVGGALLISLSDVLLSLCGPLYLPGTPVIFTLVTAHMATSTFSTIAGYSLTICGKPLLSLLVSLLSAGVNIALNLLLIPRYGMIGAAYGTGAGLICAAILSTWLLRRHVNLSAFSPQQTRYVLYGAVIVSLAVFFRMLGQVELAAICLPILAALAGLRLFRYSGAIVRS